MIDYAVVPERTALVNIDMQNCFVEGADDGVVALDRINWLAGLCRDAGILVVHTRHVQRPDGSDMGVLGDIVPKDSGRLAQQGCQDCRPTSGPRGRTTGCPG